MVSVFRNSRYHKFQPTIEQLKRISRKNIILSLPYWGYTFGLKWRLPKIAEHALQFKISGFKKHKPDKQHYWEIGKRGCGIKRIQMSIYSAGLKIDKSFWDIDDPYHYYFVLSQ